MADMNMSKQHRGPQLSYVGAALLMASAACSGAAQAAGSTMFRDPNCGCCEAWAEHFAENMHSEVSVQDSTDMTAIKERHGVPRDLRSCHTMIVEGYVIEGHVPAADLARLLHEKPEDVAGLAVAGMPVGSPGMEMGDHKQRYQVIAFGANGRSVFSSYN